MLTPVCREEERIRAIFAANATPAQPQSTGSSTTPLHHIHASSGVTEAQAQLQQGSETSPHPAGRAWCVGDKEALRQRFPMPAQDVLDKWLPGLKRTKATAPR